MKNAQLIYLIEKDWSYSQRSGTRKRYPLLPLLFDITLEVLTIANTLENGIKCVLIWKRSKTISTSRWHIFYIENPKDSAKKLLAIIWNINNVALYFYTLTVREKFIYSNRKKNKISINKCNLKNLQDFHTETVKYCWKFLNKI